MFSLHHDLTTPATKALLLLGGFITAVGLASLANPVEVDGQPSQNPQGLHSGGYRLVAEWLVPTTEVTWPVAPQDLYVSPLQREIYVVDRQPPRILVMAPDGGVQRTVGEDLLREPQSVAVMYRRGTIAGGVAPEGTSLSPDLARIWVTEPARGEVHLFEPNGQLFRTIRGLGEPWGVAVDGERAYVSDASGRRLLVFDADGSSLPSWDLGALGIQRPEAVVCTDRLDLAGAGGVWSSVRIADGRAGRVYFLDGTGKLEQVSDLRTVTGEPALHVQDISLVGWDGTGPVLALTDHGLFKITAFSAGPATLIDFFQEGDLPAVTLATAYHGFDDVSNETYRKSPWLYLAGSGNPRSMKRFLLWQGKARTNRCPWVDEEPDRVGRLISREEGDLLVLRTTGVVLAHESMGGFQKLAEVGDADDIAAEEDSVLWINAGPYVTRRLPNGVSYQLGPRYPETAWFQEDYCSPALYGVHESVDWEPQLDLVDLTVRGIWQAALWSGRANSVQLKLDSRLAEVWPRHYWKGEVANQAAVITDLASVSDSTGRRTLAVDRLAGDIVVVGPGADQTRLDTSIRWPVPGRPWRVTAAPGGGWLVLTAEGHIWQLDKQGRVQSGWDAAGAPNGRRADLVDIAADRSGTQGRVYALDRAQSRVLVFEPGPEPPVLPAMPPSCSVQAEKNAPGPIVNVGEAMTMTLRLTGSCGRMSAEDDILLLIPPVWQPWATENRRQAADVLLGSLDISQDRAAVMVKDDSGLVLSPFSTDVAALKQAVASVPKSAVYKDEVNPLLLARDYMLANARSGANRIIVVPASAIDGDYDNIVVGQRLREAGIRVIMVADSPDSAFEAINIGTEIEDVYFAPDAATMRAVYEGLGREIGARVLARELTVTDVIPSNMSYVENSALPLADWDLPSRTLTWRAAQVPFSGWQATYQLIPTELGDHPTNIRAQADVTDGYGNKFSVSFPQPWVKVIQPPTATPSPTPSNTPSPSQSPTVSPPATLKPVRLYLPLLLRDPACKPGQSPVDVVLILDASTSMAGTPLAAAKGAVLAFARSMRLGAAADNDRLALATFNDQARLLVPLGGSLAALTQALDGIRLAPGTRIDRGLGLAFAELLSLPRPQAARAIVLLTDGRQADGMVEAEQIADAVRVAGAVVHAIGLGENVDAAFLIKIAGGTKNYHPAPDPGTLNSVYLDIARQIPCPANRNWAGR